MSIKKTNRMVRLAVAMLLFGGITVGAASSTERACIIFCVSLSWNVICSCASVVVLQT